MKRIARNLITIVLVFTAASLFAQMSSNQQLMKVDIPFAFSVQDYSLPAGEYLVLTVTPERSICIESMDGKHSAIVHDLPNYTSEPSPNSRLVFRRYGDEYFLTQVWTVGQNVARNPLESKKATERASTGERPEPFTVVALADRR